MATATKTTTRATATTAKPNPQSIPYACDVVIAGGGPAGISCAIELARRGHEVLVAERGDYDAHRIGETLAPAAHGPLSALGAHGVLTDPPHRRALALRSVWGDSLAREHSYMFDPYAVGWHLDRPALDASLAAVAVALGVRVVPSARVVRLDSCVGGWRLRVAGAGGSDGWTRCRFIVDATGRPAAVARRLGARILGFDRLVAHYCVLRRSATALEPVTLIEAIREGWWYTAPLPDGRLIAALLTDHDAGSSGRRDRWLRALAGARHTAARTLLPRTPTPRTTSARSTLTMPACGERWLAVGDAASARDPLAGNGIERALSDGISAARTVHNSLDGDRDGLRARRVQLERAHGEYLRARASVYALERRWPDTEFWKQRTGVAEAKSRPRAAPRPIGSRGTSSGQAWPSANQSDQRGRRCSTRSQDFRST